MHFGVIFTNFWTWIMMIRIKKTPVVTQAQGTIEAPNFLISIIRMKAYGPVKDLKRFVPPFIRKLSKKPVTRFTIPTIGSIIFCGL